MNALVLKELGEKNLSTFPNIQRITVIIFIIHMQAKTLLHNFPVLNSQDWTIVPRQDALIAINNYTVDEFAYEKVNSNSWHLFDIYKARAQYAIPNTPQIILANYQSDAYTIEMFVQFATFGLDKLVKKNLCGNSIHQLIKTVLRTVEFLVKKFGFFRITPQMVKVTHSNNILVWVHENFNSAHRQYPLGSNNIYQDYQTMIYDFLSIFEMAGLKKILEGVKSKIETSKLLSFEKFKIILAHQLRCHGSSKQKSEKQYRSPEFLKRRNSPDSAKRAITQNFTSVPPQKQTRFATSLNLGIQSKSNSSILKQKAESIDLQNYFDQNFQRATLSNDPSFKSIQVKLHQPYFDFQQNSKLTPMTPEAQRVETNSQSADMKRKNFRDSGNSLATTAFMTSMTSSGKVKLNVFQEHNFALPNSKENDTKVLASSVGVKQTKKIRQLKDTFKVKASKIIEENNEQLGTNLQSFIKHEPPQRESFQFQFEQDIDGLLKSETSSVHRPSSDLLELENEIFNILSG